MEKWLIYSKKADFAGISRKYNISPMLARIIRNRDIVTDEQISRYLNADIDSMYDPFLLKGMHEGVKITADTISRGGRIRIMGDYDVDGVCSSYILKSFIEHVGGTADIRLPDRMREGYGMNTVMAEEAARDNISLIITCDNGISSTAAVEMARSLGINVIISDHHEPPAVLPDANVIIDPKQAGDTYPFREICGAGVAYKFVQALNIYCGFHADKLLDELLQYAGMATVADIVPLIDENRIFASEGIKRLRNTANVGLNSLIEKRSVIKSRINSGIIGFVLGPCINSAGRLKNATIALDLLEEKNEHEAGRIANELSELNDKRKKLTADQCAVADEMINSIIASGKKLNKILVVYLPDAHESVAGIVAGRIKEEFNRPSIVVTNSEDGLKGSGRSVDSYNMMEGMNSCSDLFIKYGGHAKACGFTLKLDGTREETVERFSQRINDACTLKDEDLEKTVWIDMRLPFKYITEEFVRELERLEPFGLQNEKPIFAENEIKVQSAAVIGKNNNTLKLELEDREGTRIEGLLFGEESYVTELKKMVSQDRHISILYYPQINEFRGIKTRQAMIKSLHVME